MNKLMNTFKFLLVTLALAALAPSAWADTPTEVTVTVPEVEGATAELFAFDAKGGWQAVASDKVPSNAVVRVVWTADTGKGLTAEGAVGVFQWQATLGPVVGGESVPAPTVSEAGDSEVAIAIDTRERIIVGSPEEVLPIWYAAGGEVQEKREGDEQWSSLVKNAAKADTLCWTPTDLGLYTLTQTGFESSLIIYSQPFPLSITQPAEGGSFVAITNGVEATGTIQVLGYENVTIAAKPAERWQLKEMVALTNDVEVMLKKDRASITNQFVMPCHDTIVTGAFTIAETYRDELLQAATNRYLATSNNLEKLRMHRLSEAETDAAIAAAFAGLNAAASAIADATKPFDGESATNMLASALTEVYSDAKAKSDGKPRVFLIAEDYSAIPGFAYDAATGVISYGGTPAFTNGVNAYTSFTEAFTNETYGPFAQAINVVGRQTIAMEPPMVDKWCLSLASFENTNGEKVPAVVSVDPTKGDPSELINITNNLFAIMGEGEIILGKTDAPTTIYDEFIEERPMIDRIIVKNCGVEPSKNPQNNCSQIYVDDHTRTETNDEGETFVLLPGVEDQTGGILIGVYPYATNDVKVAGRLEAPNGVVSIMNNSTNKLTLAGTVHGSSVGVYNTGRDGDVEGVFTAVSIVSDGDVEIQNNAHLEAYVVAGGKISIQNGNINTLVGTYKGSTIELLGNDPGALSNATFVSTGAVTMSGNNILTGPFTIEAPSVDNSGYLAFSVANDNHTTWLNDFDLVGGSDFCVIVGEEQTDGEVSDAYVIASNATTAVGMMFSLKGGAVSASIEVADGTDAAAVEAKKLYIGAKAYSLVVDANGALLFEVNYGKFAITYDAFGGAWTGGITVSNLDSFVNSGYTIPTAPNRDGYQLIGWFDGYTNGAANVSASQTLLYMNDHTLYAKWESTTIPAGGGEDVVDCGTASSGDPQEVSVAGGRSSVTDASGAFVVPDRITNGGNGRYVTEIGKGAFAAANYRLSTIGSVTTPLYLRRIGAGAFYQQRALRSLAITRSVDYRDPSRPVDIVIERQAFAGTDLESILIPSNVTEIGASAFVNCANLSKVVILGDGANMAIDASAISRCGSASDGISFYVSPTFLANHPGFQSALAAQNPSVDIRITSSSTALASSLGGLSVGADGRVSVVVHTRVEIPGIPPDVSKVAIMYSPDLSNFTELTDGVVKTAFTDGTVLIEFPKPQGDSGYWKVELK